MSPKDKLIRVLCKYGHVATREYRVVVAQYIFKIIKYIKIESRQSVLIFTHLTDGAASGELSWWLTNEKSIYIIIFNAGNIGGFVYGVDNYSVFVSF